MGDTMNRLFREQVRSILAAWDFWIVCAAIIAIMSVSVVVAATSLHNAEGLAGGSRYGLFLGAFKNANLIFPVACSLAVGASFAIDRKAKIAQYILTRGFHKWQYLLAKAVAMMLCSMLLIVLVQGVTWIASSALARYPIVQSFEAAGTGGAYEGNLENLVFHRAPGRYVVTIAFLQLLAVAALAGVPLLVAALGGNSWVSVISTLALWLLAEYACSSPALMFLDPGFRALALWWWRPFAAENTPCPPVLRSSFAYWGIFLLLNVGFAAFIYLRQEDA